MSVVNGFVHVYNTVSNVYNLMHRCNKRFIFFYKNAFSNVFYFSNVLYLKKKR